MLTETTYNHVTCVTGDGRNGYAPLAPYDRIIAWATPNYLPNARKNQLKNDGILVTPFQVRPLANCIVTVRLKKKNGKLFGEQVSAEGYISMTDEPLVDFFGYEAQAEIVGEGKDPYWASSIWMKKHPHNEWTQTFLSAQPISPHIQILEMIYALFCLALSQMDSPPHITLNTVSGLATVLQKDSILLLKAQANGWYPISSIKICWKIGGDRKSVV